MKTKTKPDRDAQWKILNEKMSKDCFENSGRKSNVMLSKIVGYLEAKEFVGTKIAAADLLDFIYENY